MTYGYDRPAFTTNDICDEQLSTNVFLHSGHNYMNHGLSSLSVLSDAAVNVIVNLREIDECGHFTRKPSLVELASFKWISSLKIHTMNSSEELLSQLSYVCALPYHNFSNRKIRKLFHSLYCICKTSLYENLEHMSWNAYNKCEGHDIYLAECDILSCYSGPQTDEPMTFVAYGDDVHGPFENLNEIYRAFRFNNGMVIKCYTNGQVFCKYDMTDFLNTNLDDILTGATNFSLLSLAGDVESNPGPIHSKPISYEKFEDQCKLVKNLEKEIKLLKRQNEKQNHNIQRQLELEKRNRKLKRNSGRRHAQGIMNFCKNMDTIAEDGASGVGPTIQLAQRALQGLIEAGDKLRELFKIPENIDIFGTLTSLLSLAQGIITKSYFQISINCANLARLLGVSFNQIINLLPAGDVTVAEEKPEPIVYYTNGEDQVRVGESLISDMLATAAQNTQLLPFTGFIAMLTGIFALLCTGTVPTPTAMSSMFSTIGRAANGFRSIKDLFTFISNYFQEIYYTTVYGLSKEQFQLMQDYPHIESLYAAARIACELQRDDVYSSSQLAEEILKLEAEISEYTLRASRTHMPAIVSMLNLLDRKMKYICQWARDCPARNQQLRLPPFSLYLHGHPGVGKSVLQNVITAKLYAKYYRDQNIPFPAVALTRNANNEFWDGYTHQKILFNDDFAQAVDSLATPDPSFKEIIGMVNEAPYHLHMSAVADKSNVYFDSEFVISSSNQKVPVIKSMMCPSAIYRRFHIWAEVSIDPNYGKPVVNNDDPFHKVFYRYDPVIAKQHVTQVLKREWNEEEVLQTKQYKISLYDVNEFNGSTTPISGFIDIDFDTFFDYVIAQADARRQHAASLRNCTLRHAGITLPPPRPSEKTNLHNIRLAYNANKLIAQVANPVKDLLPPPLIPEKLITIDKNIATQTERTNENFGTQTINIQYGRSTSTDSDSSEEPLEDAVEVVEVNNEDWNVDLKFAMEDNDKEQTLREKFNTYKAEMHDKLKNFMGSMKISASKLKTKFLNLAEFLLSFFSDFTSYTLDYVKRVPISGILTGIATTLVAIAGVWYTGMFRSNSSNNRDVNCKFIVSPSHSDLPCLSCQACKICAFPSSGNMLLSYSLSIAKPIIQQALRRLNLDVQDITIKLNALLITDLQQVKTQVTEISAQSKLYDQQPRQPTYKGHSQSVLFPCSILNYAQSGFQVDTWRDAMVIVGSFCMLPCKHCSKVKYTYDPFDQQSAIDTAKRILKDILPNRHSEALRGSTVTAKTEFEIGSVRYSQNDQVQIQQTTQVLLNNSVWIQAVDEDGCSSKSNGVFLVGRTMITTAHTILKNPANKPVKTLMIYNPYTDTPTISVPISHCNISQVKQLDGMTIDLVLVSFPPCVPSRPKIISKFLDAEDIDLLKEGDMVFSGFYNPKGITIVQEKYPTDFDVFTKSIDYDQHDVLHCPANPDGRCVCEPITIGNHITYTVETSKGMCGALLSVQNKLIHSKLIGFHVAGGKGVSALGALTTKQLLIANLENHVKQFNIPPTYLIDGRLPYSQSFIDTKQMTKLVETGDCINVGTTTPIPVPSKTQLLPSLVFNKVQYHITKPAALRPVNVNGELVDPMVLGMRKVMGPQTYIDPYLLEAAINDVFNNIGQGENRILSYEEAIKGVEGNPYIRPLNRKTSPGYPYNLNNPSKGKTHWLGSGEEYDVSNPELKADVEKLINDARNLTRGDAISIATLKDEKRPHAKVDAGKTRVFEACPQHLVIALRQYTLNFVAHVMKNRIDNGICVGINPYSLEWTKLANKLLSQGNNIIAGDFSNFDGSIMQQVSQAIGKRVALYMSHNQDNSEEIYNIIMTLWENISNADVLVSGDVIRQTHSQPSGNPLTVILNSIFNSIVMRLAYLILKKARGMSPICDYLRFVYEANYGDDNTLSIHRSILHWFNQQTITAALKEIGLTYTDETKSESALLYRALDDVSFLKRRFVRQDDGTYMAPMDIENVLEITNWVRSKGLKAATLENCECALRELSLHPEHIYNTYAQKIRKACADVKIQIPIPTHWEWMQDYHYEQHNYSCQLYTPLW